MLVIGGISENLCFALARKLVRRSAYLHSGVTAAFDSVKYQEWRKYELQRQFDTYFEASSVTSRDILDFGCGHGELSAYVSTLGAKSVIGIEADVDRYSAAMAKYRAGRETAPACPLSFQHAARQDTIGLPDSSIDAILCFDVLEHVMDYRAIIGEWARVLRPGGRILIWWVPWWNPFGPHIQTLVPIPWCHVLFSDKTLLRVCARVYESEDYVARTWDRDSSGRKKPNPWIDADAFPGINKLTMRNFERIAKGNGLAIARRRLVGFGSARTLRGWKRVVGRFTEALLVVPYLREFVTLHAVYELEKVA